MMALGWKVVFFLVVVSWAEAEVEEEEEEAVGEQMVDPEEVLVVEAHPGMEDAEEVGHPGMLVQMGFPRLLHVEVQIEDGLLVPDLHHC